MSNNNTFIYAVLSEYSYSRALNDHRIDLGKLGVGNLILIKSTDFPSQDSGFHAEAYKVGGKTEFTRQTMNRVCRKA